MLTQELLFTMSILSPSSKWCTAWPTFTGTKLVVRTRDLQFWYTPCTQWVRYRVILFWTHCLYYMIESTFPRILVWNLIELKLVSTFYAKLFSCNPFKTSYRFHPVHRLVNLNQIYLKQLLTMKSLCSNLGLPTFTAFFRKLLNE